MAGFKKGEWKKNGGDKASERSFLASQMRKGISTPGFGRLKRNEAILKAIETQTATFFAKKVLPDAMEMALWQVFMTGQIEIDEKNPITGEMEKITKQVKLDAICWNAFKQAVAYKRGMPTVRVDNRSTEPIEITFNVLGPTARDSTRKQWETKRLKEHVVEGEEVNIEESEDGTSRPTT